MPLLIYGIIFSHSSLAAEEFNSDPENTVATPTKMTQAVKDVPAAVSIIEGNTLRRLGLNTIPDALRLVPGMVVGQGFSWDFHVAYHGTNNYNTRRMQVLVDGMSVYRSGLSTVDWLMLPVPIKDIDRIEVTRDPSSASYGANAFQAVVNIITKAANRDNGFAASINRDLRGSSIEYLRYDNQVGKVQFGVSAENATRDGFYRSSQSIVNPAAQNYLLTNDNIKSNDDSTHSKLAITSQYDLDRKNSLQLHFGGVKTHQNENLFGDSPVSTQPNNIATDNFFNSSFTSDQFASHRIKIDFNRYQTRHTQEWRNCYNQITLTHEMHDLYLLDPAYADSLLLLGESPSSDVRNSQLYRDLSATFHEYPSGTAAEEDQAILALTQKLQQLGGNAMQLICGTLNQNYIDSKNTFEVQDTWALNNNLRAVTGMGNAHNSTDSATFLNGTVTEDKRWLYSNIEWRPAPTITANIGTMLERDGINARFYNMPRAAIGYDFLPNQTVKWLVSLARRSPDLSETSLSWRNHLTNLQTPSADGASDAYYYRSGESKNKLVAETDISQALIWLGRAPTLGLSYEIKVFKEKMYNLISENFSIMDSTTNDGKVDMSGLEYQLRYKITPQLTLLHSYAYLDQQANTDLETQLYARHSGSFALLAEMGKYQYTASYYGSDFRAADSFDEFDFLIGRKYAIRNQTLSWQSKITYFPNNSFSQTDAALTKLTSVYHRGVSIGLELGLEW